MSVLISIHVLLHKPVRMSWHTPVHMSLHVSIHTLVHMFVTLSVSIQMPVHISVHISMHMLVHVSIHMFLCTPIHVLYMQRKTCRFQDPLHIEQCKNKQQKTGLETVPTIRSGTLSLLRTAHFHSYGWFM